MNVDEKLTLLFAVESSGFNVSEALVRLDVPRTTYYRWRAKYKKFGTKGLTDKRPIAKRKWKKSRQQ